ncbi:BON domain-containing protein [Luteibacter yeojuensis]
MNRFDERYDKPLHDDTRYPGDEFGGTYGYRDSRDFGGSPYEAGRGPRQGHRHPGHRGVGPKGYVRSDERIHEDLCERLSEHDAIDASGIEVRVAGGVVQLSGEVPERYMKHLAEDAVSDAMGVKDVENAIRVRRGGQLEERQGELGMFDEPSRD